jgi:4-amino-4-deoxy-L-arabinose transferase-like glycosyltransferase
MHFLKRHPKKAAFWIGITLLFFFTRFYNLFILPIFTDEAIYIYWAKFIESTHSNWFISLADGKPPLLIWIIAIFLSIFPHDWYLLAGRLPSIITGFMSVIAIYLLAKELFRTSKAGYFAAILYTLFPFTLLYDRMALFDGMLQSMILWGVYFAVRTARTLLFRDALLWGFFLGLAILSKPTALMYVVMTPVAFLMLTKADLKKDWKKIGLSILTAVVVALGIDNMQRVSAVYERAAIKNAQFQQPLSELIKDPFALTYWNMRGMIDWTVAYFSYPVLIFGLLAFIYLLIKKTRIALILGAFWLVPLFALATVGREIFPRYILFTTPYFLLGVSYLLSVLYNENNTRRIGTIILLVLLLIQPLIMVYYILTDPTKAALAKEDKQQYVTHHPAGYGVKEVTDFVDREVQKGQDVTLVTQGTFGLFPYAFTLNYWENPNVTILPRWPLDTLDREIYEKAQNSKVIIVFKEHDEVPRDLPLRLIQKVPKPGGIAPILITELDRSSPIFDTRKPE